MACSSDNILCDGLHSESGHPVKVEVKKGRNGEKMVGLYEKRSKRFALVLHQSASAAGACAEMVRIANRYMQGEVTRSQLAKLRKNQSDSADTRGAVSHAIGARCGPRRSVPSSKDRVSLLESSSRPSSVDEYISLVSRMTSPPDFHMGVHADEEDVSGDSEIGCSGHLAIDNSFF